MKHEQKFEKDLERIAPLFGCLYIKIPDFIPLKRYGDIIAHRRPFDAVLFMPYRDKFYGGNTFCIECKIDNNKLKPHQKVTQDKICEVNKSYYILRKKFLKKGVVYRIEQPEKNVLWETNKIEKIIEFFS